MAFRSPVCGESTAGFRLMRAKVRERGKVGARMRVRMRAEGEDEGDGKVESEGAIPGTWRQGLSTSGGT